MEIVKMLTISTAHIKEETSKLFNDFLLPFDVGIYDKGSYGWFLFD